jgi:hypothetical protein
VLCGKAIAFVGDKFPILAEYGLDIRNCRPFNREVKISYRIALDRLGDEMPPADVHATGECKRAVHDEKLSVISEIDVDGWWKAGEIAQPGNPRESAEG